MKWEGLKSLLVMVEVSNDRVLGFFIIYLELLGFRFWWMLYLVIWVFTNVK